MKLSNKIDNPKIGGIEHDLGLPRDTDCQNTNEAETLASHGL